MADRTPGNGTPKALPAKARAATPSKTTQAVLPVKANAEKAAPPSALPVKASVQKAAKRPAPVKPVKIEAAPVVPFVAPVAEPASAPASTASQISAALIGDAAVEQAEKAEQIVANIQETVKEGIELMDAKTTQTIEAGKDASKTAADQAQALFGDFNDRAKGVMEKNAKIVQEVTDLTKGNVEAIVTSTRVAAKGIESLSREAAEYGRKSFEDASGALKSFSEVRSPADLFRLQSDYVRSYFDAMVSETSKMSEAVLKIAGEVAEPITNRYSVAAERVRTIAL